MLYAKLTALSSMEPELLPIEVSDCGNLSGSCTEPFIIVTYKAEFTFAANALRYGPASNTGFFQSTPEGSRRCAR